jgi:hypothetical protein
MMLDFMHRSKSEDLLFVHLAAGEVARASVDLPVTKMSEGRIDSGLDPILVDLILGDKVILPGLKI